MGNVSGGKKKGPRLLPQPGAGRRGASGGLFCTVKQFPGMNCLPEPDPAKQADARETAWERFRGEFPVCALCGEPILGDTRYYFRRLDKFACPACISWAEEPNEPFEIEYPEED